MNDQRLPQEADNEPGLFLGCTGEMAARMARFDWSETPLGAPSGWPLSLQTTLRIALRSRFAMWMCWGPELTFFCNDAYLPTLGVKGSWALGSSSRKVWEEIWPDIGPRIDGVLTKGVSTWDEGLLLYLERSGLPEETYHTFSYSPLSDDTGRIHGMLCVVAEETVRFIGERRVEFLSHVAIELNGSVSEEQLLSRAKRLLEDGRHLLPFSLIYLYGDRRTDLSLRATTGLTDSQAEHAQVATVRNWPVTEVLESMTAIVADEVTSRFGRSVCCDQGTEVRQALVMPITGQGSVAAEGVFVAGLNPYQPYNAAYENFLRLLVGQIASCLASARSHAAERQRAVELAELDRAKTRFFSNISHEFRTPLTLMLGPTEAAIESPERVLRDEDLDLVYRNELRLLKLVNTLLDFSRIEAGRFETNPEPTDLAALTSGLVSVFRSAADQAGIALTVDCAVAAPVLIDRDLWEKVLLNLLSNALKHTMAGSITVALTHDDGTVTLKVADTGCGIPADELPHIFTRFKRIHTTQRRSNEGTGIGLSLVKEIAELNGGKVSATSRLGEGSEFTVTIPAEFAMHSEVVEHRLTLAAPAYTLEASHWNGKVTELLSPTVPPDIEGERPVLLLADDNVDMRSYIGRLLSDRFRVISTSNGLEALGAIRLQKPDIVVSDVMMPQMDGFELLNAVRADPSTAAIPVLLVSARAGEEARIEGIAAGADDYITKPFSAREVVARVSGALALSRFRREAQRTESNLIAERNDILENIADGFLLIDADWTLRYANRAAEEMLEQPREELVGRRFWALYPTVEHEPYGDSLRHVMLTRQQTLAEHFYTPWNRWYENSICPANNAGISVYFRDVTEHKRMVAALKQADRRKDEFLATLAHELRNPLAPIRNAAEILASGNPSARQLTWTGAVIGRQVNHMTRLLDDLLDVSRITMEKMQIRPELLPLRDVIDSAIEAARPLIESRGHTLTLVMDEQLPLVNADPIRLAQVLSNLLTNAAKYTDAGGEINLECSIRDRWLCFKVIDTGIGLSPESRGSIFEMFTQAEAGQNHTQGGLGIGLALVKGIVELHGGNIRVDSAGLGRGSTFTIHLPVVHLTAGPVTQNTVERPAFIVRRILIADDNRDGADSMAMLLEMDGHEVRVAYNGKEALTATAEFRPEVAIIDIGMPDMNGYEVARRIRIETAATGRLTLIALTGFGQEKDQLAALDAGFDHHLTKPTDVDNLRHLILGLND